MKRSRFSPEQIAKMLKENDQGTRSEELCRVHGISRQTFYKWRSKYSGMESGDLKRLQRTGRRKCQAQTHVWESGFRFGSGQICY